MFAYYLADDEVAVFEVRHLGTVVKSYGFCHAGMVSQGTSASTMDPSPASGASTKQWPHGWSIFREASHQESGHWGIFQVE